MTQARWFVSAVLAAGITAGLFYFMQYLIETGDRFADPVRVVRVVDSTMPEFEPELIKDVDKPVPIEQVEEEEEDRPERRPTLDPTPSVGIVGTGVEADSIVDLVPTHVDTGNTDLVPLVAIQPQYPTRAAQRGLEGWCLVSFTVDGQGNVIEDSITVLDSEPPDIFDRASTRAAARFKFQPRVEDGEGIEVAGVQYLFRYDLND